MILNCTHFTQNPSDCCVSCHSEWADGYGGHCEEERTIDGEEVMAIVCCSMSGHVRNSDDSVWKKAMEKADAD